MVTSTAPSASPAADAALFDERDDIVIGEGVVLQVPAAGFLLRAGSAIVDALVVLIGAFLTLWGLFTLFEAWMRTTGSMIEEAWIYTSVTLVMAGWVFVVPLVVETLSNGRSLGRLIFGLRIVRLDGGAIALRHSLVRALVGIAEIYLTMGGIAALTGMLTRRAQRVGDLLAGTYAQLERLPKAVPLQLVLPPRLTAWAGIADVALLPDRLARRIRDFFLQAPRLEPAARARLAGRLARQTKAYVHPVPDVDAETFLAGVAVVRRERERRGIAARGRRLERLDPLLEQLPHAFPDRG